MKNFKKIMAIMLAIIVLVPGLVLAQPEDFGTAKNVIVMIPDGMNVESVTTTRWMTEGYEFTFDSMATGLVKTHNANTPIADSAPAGTSMATGYKTQSPYIGTYPSEGGMPGFEFDPSKAMMPIANVLEGAERLGKSTGIISTSNVQHATPADFSAHNPNRNNYDDLAEQQVYQGMEVVLGAGSRYLDPNERKDGEDLISVIKDLGYDYVTNTADMKASNSDKLWGMFAEKSLDYDIDRDPAEQPSLAEMTEKALEILSKNDEGFFLMVEGSEIDWAAHANDPVGIRSEIQAFDKAVKVAKDFADEHGDTVLVIATDHGTGGMTFGERAITKGYDREPLESFTRYIKNAKLTGQGFEKVLNEDRSNVREQMADVYGITDLTDEEVEAIKEAKYVQDVVGAIVSERSYIGWTTGGHVGGDVALYWYSTADNVKPLKGTINNAEIGQYVANIMNIDLDGLTEKLYIPAREGYEALGAEISFVYNENTNHEVKVTKGDTEIILPISKNYAIVNGEEVDLGGLIIYNTEQIYVPQTALDLVK